MNIKTKLTYGIGLLFVLITLLGGLAIKNIHNVSDDTQNINPAKRKATPIKNEKRFSEQKRKAMKIIKAILEIVSPLLLH